MKIVRAGVRYLLALSALCLLISCGEKTEVPSPDLENLRGTWIGVSPASASSIGVGEIEIAVSASIVHIRKATGLEIKEGNINTSELKVMSREDIAKELEGVKADVLRFSGYQVGSGYPKFLFLNNPTSDEFGLLVTVGAKAEKFSPTLLFSPTQVSDGKFDKLIIEFEKTSRKGALPRLRNGGKAESQ